MCVHNYICHDDDWIGHNYGVDIPNNTKYYTWWVNTAVAAYQPQGVFFFRDEIHFLPFGLLGITTALFFFFFLFPLFCFFLFPKTRHRLNYIQKKKCARYARNKWYLLFIMYFNYNSLYFVLLLLNNIYVITVNVYNIYILRQS